jgi:hypothetical protein
MEMDVSVIVATYNRAYLLEATLRALGSQEIPNSVQWEIVRRGQQLARPHGAGGRDVLQVDGSAALA